ncbi:MAG: fumarylacetoacetate hydrolase family protein [Pseudomonadota bacterium]
MALEQTARQIAEDITARAPFCLIAGLSLADAYDLQDIVAEHLGPVGGYKIAWNGPGLPERFGMTDPAVARVFAGELRETGAVLDAADFRQPTLEPEIAAVLGADIPANDVPYTGDSVAPFISGYRVAFEVLDRRDVSAPHGESIIAGGVFNRGAVLGEALLTTLPKSVATLDLDGERLLDRATGTAPQPPTEAVAYVANLMLARGAPLSAGMVILCGSHRGLLTISQGSDAAFEIEGLGRVTCSLR